MSQRPSDRALKPDPCAGDEFMKLHEALRKVIRHFGVNVIEEKRLMSFLADYRAFDDYPAVKEVMRAIATGDSGKKICLAADVSDE